MKNYLAILAVFLFFAVSFADIFSPDEWFSFRRDSISFSAGLGNITQGETVVYELQLRDETGRVTVLGTQRIQITDSEWNISFPSPNRDVVGQNGLWLQETVGGETRLYGPFGFIRTALLETELSINIFNDHISNFPLTADDRFAFAYNRNGLFVAFNTNMGDIMISLDPANSKTAFLSFANRVIRFNSTENTVEFLFPERSADQRTNNAIQYRVRDWEGNMTTQNIANGIVAFIPWYDLGMLFEEGRRFGFMVEGDNVLYPARTSRHAPSTWSNIILR